MIPVDPVSKALMFPPQIETVEVGVVTGTVPPGSLEPGCTVIPPSIVIIIESTELCSLLWQTLTKLSVYTGVDNTELESLRPYDEVVDGNLRGVPVPVLHFNQQLLGRTQGYVVPVFKANPVVRTWVPKSIFVPLPLSEEEVISMSIVSPSVENSPATPMCLHVTVDSDVNSGYQNGVGSALTDTAQRVQVST